MNKPTSRLHVEHRPRVRLDTHRDEAVRLYEAGQSSYEIGARFGFDATSVRNALRRWGVILRAPSTSARAFRRLSAHRDDLVRLYREGLSTVELAARFDEGDESISRALKRLGEPMRTRAEAVRLGGLKSRLALPADEIVRLYGEGFTVNELARRFTSVSRGGSANRVPIYRVLRDCGVTLRSASDEMRARWKRGTARRARPSDSERRLHQALSEVGVKATPQVFIGEHKVDFAISEPARLAVEVQCSHHNGPRSSVRRERLEQLFNAGFAVLVVWSTDAKRDPIDAPAVAQQVVAFTKALCRKPAARCQYGVIGSHGQPMTPRSFKPPQGSRVKGF